MRTVLATFVRAAIGACAVAACASSATDGTVTTATGLRYRVVERGSGPEATAGQSVRIHETTALGNGTVLYSTRTKNTPVTFLLGGNQVIAGVEEGVAGMRVGERRSLIVPPSLSRRSSYPPNTPPDSTLYIDVELLEILPKRSTS